MGSDTIRQLSMGYCCCSYNVYVRVTIDFYCRVVSQTLLCNADVLYITRIMNIGGVGLCVRLDALHTTLCRRALKQKLKKN
ncbi:unnamed protein product, partial [Brugia timori]|uniref:DUF4773 domain-containing protein n=1 Tax=Brugia timori TaxID=42155 RepID=A0A0R3QN63_9BILA